MKAVSVVLGLICRQYLGFIERLLISKPYILTVQYKSRIAAKLLNMIMYDAREVRSEDSKTICLNLYIVPHNAQFRTLHRLDVGLTPTCLDLS
jgi:hypothetical protein